MTTEPTDAELQALWVACDHPLPQNFARAVLAKWGTPPAVAGEPDFYTACAWYEGGGEGGWIALPGYSNETEHGVKHLVLEAARKEGYKGTAAGRLLELGWEIRPVFLTPQPTQAQAGAVPVPLTDEQKHARNPYRHSRGAASIWLAGFAAAELWYRIGIKGGQHGADT
ncbi:hypothetical protein [Acidovorax sp.]|uniref:hypothetical protein n=1 Tax=Acidovorax sp. TaxID=1872122 RepID=UPI0025C03640|nr:hypothetical protein [Acidovorax sp.]MBL7091695.1 hypothetical protein [Acidovorax sp.]